MEGKFTEKPKVSKAAKMLWSRRVGRSLDRPCHAAGTGMFFDVPNPNIKLQIVSIHWCVFIVWGNMLIWIYYNLIFKKFK